MYVYYFLVSVVTTTMAMCINRFGAINTMYVYKKLFDFFNVVNNSVYVSTPNKFRILIAMETDTAVNIPQHVANKLCMRRHRTNAYDLETI